MTSEVADIGAGGIDLFTGELVDEEDRQRIGDPLNLFGGQTELELEEAQRIQEQFQDEAIRAELQSRAEAQGFFQPFANIAQQAVDQAGFLTDPQAQFDFLQNNPLFELALENANQQTNRAAAAQGRLSSGDTLQQLSNNVLLSSQPLIDRQAASIGDLLNLGQGIATSQANTAIGQGTNIANLLTGRGDIAAAGAAARNANQQETTQGLISLASLFFSDTRLKQDLEPIGFENGYQKWQWNWNDLAKSLFGLEGSATGVMAGDVLNKNPEAVHYHEGYALIDYGSIGVTYGD